MRMRHWLLVALLGASGGGCGKAESSLVSGSTPAGNATASSAAKTKGPIELFSWWARVGESDALGALMRVHNQRYPSDTMINASAELSGLARKTLHERMLKGEPPDTFQANIGHDLDQWVIVNGLDDRESRLFPLDEQLPAEVAEWRRQMPPVLVNLLSHDGRMYGLPSNIHRVNSLFYNKHVFERYGLSEPKSPADFDGLARRLAGSNIPLIAIGSREPWTLALVVFECLMVALEGPKFYEDYWHGVYDADDPRIVALLDKALLLLKYANRDHPQLSWLQALEMVVRGQAALTVMGDWARVSFNARGLKRGVDYDEMPFPGTASTLVFTSDAFSLPRGAKNKEGARRLLSTMGSLEGQIAMNTAKGALCARKDAIPPGSDASLTEKHRLLTQGNMVLALSGIVPQRIADDVGQSLAESAAQDDMEPTLLTLRSRHTLLR